MQPTGYPAPMAPVRPAGVTILAILYFIQGIAWLGGGFLLGAWLGAGLGSGLGLVCGGIGVVIGIFYFIVGWGLLTLQHWARTVALILAILGLLNFPIGTLISILILWYLFRPEIKAAFGEYVAPAPGYYPPPYQQPYQQYPGYGQPGYPQQPGYPPAGYQQPAYAPPPAAPVAPAAPAPTGQRFCANCGSPLPANATFCANCGAKV